MLEAVESEWKDTIALSAPYEVCRAMLGETLSVEDKLKLSGTKLLAAMEMEGGGEVVVSTHPPHTHSSFVGMVLRDCDELTGCSGGGERRGG